VFFHQTHEIKARRIVDAHLKSIMTGNGNPYATVDITKVKEIFINVLDFKYLNTFKKERVQNDPMVFNQKDYEEFYKKIYDSYEKFLQEMKRIYGDRATETEEGLIVKSEDYHYEFEFLYDVTLTNKLGMKIYKKYVFEVKPSRLSDSGYVITGFYER
jgi:6-pyruvoyl-tetrahydropterin synthase